MNSNFRKAFLSVFAIILFGAYAGYERMHGDSADLVTLVMSDLASKDISATGSNNVPVETPTAAEPVQQESAPVAVRPTPTPPPAITRRRREEEDSEYGEDEGYRYTQTQAQPAPTPSPTPTPAPTPTATPVPTPTPPAPVASSGQYKDGTYTGPSVNVFYGYVQIEAVIQGGKLADVKFLSYPNDRNTSRYINGQAMPILIQQALSAQSAQVDGVSGATDTSQGFIESLGSALSKAHA